MIRYRRRGSRAPAPKQTSLALRIARAVTGGTGVIVTQHCYHGNSAAIAELSAKYAGASGLPDHVCTIPAPDAYRPLDDLEGQALADAYVDRVAQAIESMHARGIRLAALMVDSIFSGEGLPDVPRGFLAKAVALARAAGGLFIADEVQPGFGRTGDHMWGYASHRVVPDIATMGNRWAMVTRSRGWWRAGSCCASSARRSATSTPSAASGVVRGRHCGARGARG